MKSLFILTIILLSTIESEISANEMVSNECAGNALFKLRYIDTYKNALQRFVNQGGDPDTAIVPITSILSILDNYSAKSIPEKFVYNKKTRNAYAYKFGLSSNCVLRISKYEYHYRRTDPTKNVHHHLAAGGEQVYSAGAIFFFHDGNNIEKIVISNRSSRFCPSFESLNVVRDYLEQLGINGDLINLHDNTRRSCINRKEF